jgi:hypothetical protein
MSTAAHCTILESEYRELIGSTAEHVLKTLPCDVLVVKSPDFAQNLPF